MKSTTADSLPSTHHLLIMGVAILLFTSIWAPAFCGITDYIDQLLDTTYSRQMTELKSFHEKRFSNTIEDNSGADPPGSSQTGNQAYLDALGRLTDDIYHLLAETTFLDQPEQDYRNQIREKILERLYK